MMKIPARLAWLVGLTVVACSGTARGQRDTATSSSALHFVQTFYDGYVSHVLRAHAGPSWQQVMERTPPILSSDLLRGLVADSVVRSKNADIAGIDFDPFLAAQDPCEQYVVGSDSVRDGVHRVEVFGVCSGARHARPDVVALVTRERGRWIFTNFLYPNEHSDLLAELRRGRPR
jgi:hypothetical protein